MSVDKAEADFMERLLRPQTKEDYEAVMEHAHKLIDRLIEMLTPGVADIFIESMRAIRNVRDLDYVHFLFFACIPTISDITASVQKTCSSPARWERFLNELLYCRSTFIDGWTPDRTECKTNLDAHFKSMREFVAYMREFYLLRSESPKRRFFDPRTTVAFWDNPDKIAASVDFAKEGGTAFFQIIAAIMFCDFSQVYCGDPKDTFVDVKRGVTMTFLAVADDAERKIQPLPYQAIFPRPVAQMQNHRMRRQPQILLQGVSTPPTPDAVVLNVSVSPVVGQ